MTEKIDIEQAELQPILSAEDFSLVVELFQILQKWQREKTEKESNLPSMS